MAIDTRYRTRPIVASNPPPPAKNKTDTQIDRFEPSSTWLAPALASKGSDDPTKAPTAWTYAKGAGRVVVGIASVFVTLGALAILALLQRDKV